MAEFECVRYFNSQMERIGYPEDENLYHNIFTTLLEIFRNWIGTNEIRSFVLNTDTLVYQFPYYKKNARLIRRRASKSAEYDVYLSDFREWMRNHVLNHDYVPFTIMNIANYDEETHYVSAIYERRLNTILYFDPSLGTKKEARLYGGLDLYSYTMLNQVCIEYTIRLELDLPIYRCQRNKKDVFCQTWSLYYLYCKMNNVDMICNINMIPREERLSFIVNFIKRLIESNSVIFNQFVQSYIKESKKPIRGKRMSKEKRAFQQRLRTLIDGLNVYTASNMMLCAPDYMYLDT